MSDLCGKCFWSLRVSALVLECFHLSLRFVFHYKLVFWWLFLYTTTIVSHQWLRYSGHEPNSCISSFVPLVPAWTFSLYRLYVFSCLVDIPLDILTDVSHVAFLSSWCSPHNTAAQLMAFLSCRCSVHTTWNHLDRFALASHSVCLEILLLSFQTVFSPEQPFVTCTAATVLSPDFQ